MPHPWTDLSHLGSARADSRSWLGVTTAAGALRLDSVPRGTPRSPCASVAALRFEPRAAWGCSRPHGAQGRVFAPPALTLVPLRPPRARLVALLVLALAAHVPGLPSTLWALVPGEARGKPWWHAGREALILALGSPGADSRETGARLYARSKRIPARRAASDLRLGVAYFDSKIRPDAHDSDSAARDLRARARCFVRSLPAAIAAVPVHSGRTVGSEHESRWGRRSDPRPPHPQAQRTCLSSGALGACAHRAGRSAASRLGGRLTSTLERSALEPGANVSRRVDFDASPGPSVRVWSGSTCLGAVTHGVLPAPYIPRRPPDQAPDWVSARAASARGGSRALGAGLGHVPRETCPGPARYRGRPRAAHLAPAPRIHARATSPARVQLPTC